jgi:cobalt-zinc-cadmium efflux system outer membrane protein
MDLAYAEKRLGTLDQLTAGLAGLWEGQPAAVASGAARPAAGLEPVRLQALFEDMRSDLVAEAARARAELVRWTGASDPAVAGSPPGIEVRPARLRAGLESLPALAAREAVTRRAQAAADAARAARRPDWAVEVAYGRRDPMFGDMVSAGVTVSLPLFAARRQDPIIAARNAEAARTRLEREATRRALSAALEADLATYAARREQWRRAVEVLVPAAEQRADLEVRSYAAGRATYDDVTAALTALAETRLEALAREAAVLREGARITLTYGPDQ